MQQVGKLAYQLALLSALGKVHDVFYISQHKWYIPTQTYVLDPEPLELDKTFSYEEKPIRILDSKVRCY